jgi:hypothetical protein
MKSRITVTLNPETVIYIQEIAEAENISRSEALEKIIRERKKRQPEAALDALAKEFFAEEMDQEREETRAFERLSLEVISRED